MAPVTNVRWLLSFTAKETLPAAASFQEANPAASLVNTFAIPDVPPFIFAYRVNVTFVPSFYKTLLAIQFVPLFLKV